VLRKQEARKVDNDKKQSRGLGETIKRIWLYLSDHRSLMAVVLLMVVASSGLGLLGPFLIGWGIDKYFAADSTDGFTWLLIGLAVVYGLHS
jgi:ATP-binding cassette, subfamily B, multidrug efflux pump